MFESQPMPNPEPEMNFKDSYKRPHEIAKKIRKLREEFQNDRTQIERREDILKEHKDLKTEREDIKIVLSKYLEDNHGDIKIPLGKAKELMQEAEKDMKHARISKNNNEFDRAQENWYEAYDFVRILERKDDYLMTMKLEDED